MPYTLQKYRSPSSRHTCPQCGAKRSFTRYVDTVTGKELGPEVGRCNHENRCGYHYKPSDFFRDHPDKKTPFTPMDSLYRMPVIQERPSGTFSTIDPAVVEESRQRLDDNPLVIWLRRHYGEGPVSVLCDKYKMGTWIHRGQPAVVFWQVDRQKRVRTGKVMHYNPETGHRIKTMNATWIHAIHPDYRRPATFDLRQCLYGEHLLNFDPVAPVALVESEKTALILSLEMPEFLWMATGSLTEFKNSKLSVLEGRRICAWPDLGAYERWKERAAQLTVPVIVSNFLERHASHRAREEGLDVGDVMRPEASEVEWSNSRIVKWSADA